MEAEPTTPTSRAVLVLGSNYAARALITTVHVRASTAREPRLRFSGPVRLGDVTREHVNDVLVPIVDQVAVGLGLEPCGFDIAIANPGAVALQDGKTSVGGYSADVPLLLGMLAARLGMELPADLIGTGHISSRGGEITPVRSIPAKLEAIAADASLKRCVVPDWDRDPSLQALTPQERERVAGAIAAAKERLRIMPVGNVAELVRCVYAPAQLALAALRGDYFDRVPRAAASDPVAAAVRHFLGGNAKRFWTALATELQQGVSVTAVDLLAARAEYELRRRTYPSGLGYRLHALVAGLPPATRRTRIRFPLPGWRGLDDLVRFAEPADYDDVQHLMDAVSGRVSASGPSQRASASSRLDGRVVAADALDVICSEVSAAALAKAVDAPIDDARGSFPLDGVTIRSSGDLLEAVTAYTIHLLHRTGDPEAGMDPNKSGLQALMLLEQIYPGEHGFNAALAEARFATEGGLRFILDAITKQYRQDKRTKYVNWVFKCSLEDLEEEERVEFIRTLLERLGPLLPADLRTADPADFADGCEELARAYVAALDQIHERLRRY
jgi:hypothetical protein